MVMAEGLTGWPAAIALVVGGVLIGFRIYLQTRKDIRGDQGHEVLSTGYKALIEDLQKELIRRGAALEKANKVHEENLKLKSELSAAQTKIAALEAVVRTQLDPKNRRLT